MGFTIRTGDSAPWGDYGSILVHGMGRRGRDGVLELHRTGPYAPKAFRPAFSTVVEDSIRVAIEKSGLKGAIWRPTRKTHIVKLHWHKWDMDAPDPKRYPRESEPENYIEGCKHSPDTAATMPDYWELTGTPTGRVDRSRSSPRWFWDGQPALDFIQPADPTWDVLVLSKSARDFFLGFDLAALRFERSGRPKREA